jgi:FKBP-type peptidyl-prolyl cis-trans isomerase FklB
MSFSYFALPLALASLASAPAFAQQAAAAPDGLTTPAAQASYAIGLNIGSNLRTDGVTIEADPFLRGVKDALAAAKPALTADQMNEALNTLQADVDARRNEKTAAAASANQAEGAAFLKANGAKPGVVTLADGLQYQILTAGKGPKPTAADTVMCNYRGTLLSGKEFDASTSHGGPASLPVGGVIPGWTEALELMPVGSKWRLFVPADLAYGPRGAGDDIGPNATLIFEIELLSIAKD